MTNEELLSLLQALDIDRLLDRGDNITGLCPHGERNPSFGISTVKEGHPWSCFSCGRKGRLPSLVMWVNNCTYRQALHFIARYGVLEELTKNVVPEFDAVKKVVSEFGEIHDYAMAPYLLYERRAKLYLKRRGISTKTLSKLTVGFDRRQKRVVFPYYLEKKLIGANGRRIDNLEPKTVTYFGYKKSSGVYIPFVRKNTTMVLVEGEVDALAVMDKTDCMAVALGWNHISNEQAAIISSLSSQWTVYPDSDNGGIEMLETFVKKLGSVVRFKVAWPSAHGLDPASESPKSMRKSLKKAACVVKCL